jgi:deoxyribonuclease V
VSSSARCSEDVDLNGIILDAVNQVPSGRVTTYGDIAKALGDVKAARAVAEVLSHLEPQEAPRHRIVNQNGEIGWEADAGTPSAKLLRKEKVHVRNGVVEDLERLRFTDFKVHPVLSRLRQEQEDLRPSIIELDDFGETNCVAGMDVSYSGDKTCIALVRMDLKSFDVLEVRCAVGEVRFPYIPGYLSYRELPMVRKVYREEDQDILLIDGQGVLHPRGFGIACHIGLCLDLPTVGAAKSLLIGTIIEHGKRDEILVDGNVRGMRLHPDRGKGVFVSVGHRVSLNTACDLCEKLMTKRAPEPLRLAHIIATREKKAMELEQ